jgi:hypothetical protein
MSLEQAFYFLSQVRKDKLLRSKVFEIGDELTTDKLVEIGIKHGYFFDAIDLNQAYKNDWTMRWMHYRLRKNNR